MKLVSIEEWVKRSELTVLTSLRKSEESVALIDIKVDELIEKFSQRMPSENQVKCLRALNQAHGDIAVDLIRLKLTAVENFEGDKKWLKPGKEGHDAIQNIKYIKKRVRAMTKRVEKITTECRTFPEY